MEHKGDHMEESVKVPKRAGSIQPDHGPAVGHTCMHNRMIDDVLTARGKRTGKIRCLECQAVINDTYHSGK